MSHRMKTRFVLDALHMAIDRRGAPAGLLWHSDRGGQYADALTRVFAGKYGIELSDPTSSSNVPTELHAAHFRTAWRCLHK